MAPRKKTGQSAVDPLAILESMNEGLGYTKAELEKLSVEKINALAAAVYQKIDDLAADFYRAGVDFYSLDDLKGYPKLLHLFKLRNKRLPDYVRKHRLWKKTIKKETKTQIEHALIESIEPFVSLEIPESLVEKALIRCFDWYKNDLNGHAFLITLSKSGSLKALHVEDTADRDMFFEFLLESARRTRAGGSPNLSATIFKDGSRVYGQDGKIYKVISVKKVKRWVADEDQGVPKAKPKLEKRRILYKRK